MVRNKDQIADGESQIKSQILLKINLQQWKEKLKTKKKTQKKSNFIMIELKVPSILSPNEVIKLIIKEVYTIFGYIIKRSTIVPDLNQANPRGSTITPFEISTKDTGKRNSTIGQKLGENRFALKSTEFEEYFFGSESLINYSYVQNLIRFNKNFECMLCEIPKCGVNIENIFPPFITYEDSDHLFEKLRNFDWDYFKKTDI
jgi:hypothetical protein